MQEEVHKNTEALKFTNNRLLQLEKLSEATSKAVCQLVDIIAKLPDLEVPVRVDEAQKGSGEYVSQVVFKLRP